MKLILTIQIGRFLLQFSIFDSFCNQLKTKLLTNTHTHTHTDTDTHNSRTGTHIVENLANRRADCTPAGSIVVFLFTDIITLATGLFFFGYMWLRHQRRDWWGELTVEEGDGRGKMWGGEVNCHRTTEF